MQLGMPKSGRGMFSEFLPLIRAADGLSLRQVCSLTGLEASTIQNWIKRGFVSHPEQKKYRERQLARILLISALRDCMKIDSIGSLLAMVNGDADDTEDDIISEEQLYDYLCLIIAATDKPLSAADAPGLAQRVTSDWEPPSDDARERLINALTVMALAYTAGQYKKEADRIFNSMKEKAL